MKEMTESKPKQRLFPSSNVKESSPLLSFSPHRCVFSGSGFAELKPNRLKINKRCPQAYLNENRFIYILISFLQLLHS